MKQFIMHLYETTKSFSLFDFGAFKITLVFIGILLGVYFVDFLASWIIVIWVIGVISYVWLMYKVITYYRGNLKR